mmetsp:Transcript_37209/g.57146  ORF Transcript_37209/g.57146 Transcript_37209/m.57146 type:complete len:170 (+) Transcript_37209:55-564(+)|eukprot:CAMPEP_0118700866 /NCGR_PEP_ID=MMETSP0800-20121206/16864_1 /TAXON_ID=210618 ORGANISM="Striatella unipunctata, Strain CCMP2910" /NCGR_SAMPLE_ID=MMETSP0800 /ASSEMBLY_ACC=CAM_ASM_000638 /LENGTH=169 /DNA_ID=CAMNT_0006601585 /DNA_START=24 /DNA_END=533 /DNA_ORIENTATION=+
MENDKGQVTDMERFTSTAGSTRSLKKHQLRKQKHFVHNATLLKSYRKAVVKEGFDPTLSRSKRKRRETEEDRPRKGNRKDLDDEPGEANKRKKTKANSLQRARKEKERRQEALDQAQKDRDLREKERFNKQKQRKRRTKLLSKRTKNGQPVMKYVINDMLTKLKSKREE